MTAIGKHTPDVSGPILLTCHAAGCNARAHAQLGHLENLLAAGPWTCSGCTGEAPC